MPAPLTWDAPSLFWDVGATWDGVAGPHHMSKVKAIVDFSPYTAAELGPIAQTIHDRMLENATTFTAPPIIVTALQTEVTTYNEKLVARASRATADIFAFNDARRELEEALAVLGNYVNGVAKGDATIVEKSGFPFYETVHPARTGAPAAPANLRLVAGDVPGAIRARYRPDRENSANEVQVCTGDPNVEANWQDKGTFRNGRADLDGFTPGTLVWVRVRTIGLRNVMGAWSDPAQIRVP